MVKEYPSISIITVVRNDVNNIERTINSVLNLNYDGEIEYIVIDGASTDGTIDIINRYKDNISLILSEPDKGVYDAMNKGIALSHGEFVNFMNSGDTFHDVNAVKDMNLDSLVDRNTIVYGDVSVKYWDGIYVEHPNEFFNTFMKFKGVGICHQTMFFPGDIIRKMEYDLKYRIAADYDLAYRMWKNKVNFVRRNVIVADYEWGNGISSNPKKLLDVYRENAAICHQTLSPLYWAKILLELYRLYKKK